MFRKNPSKMLLQLQLVGQSEDEKLKITARCENEQDIVEKLDTFNRDFTQKMSVVVKNGSSVPWPEFKKEVTNATKMHGNNYKMIAKQVNLSNTRKENESFLARDTDVVTLKLSIPILSLAEWLEIFTDPEEYYETLSKPSYYVTVAAVFGVMYGLRYLTRR